MYVSSVYYSGRDYVIIPQDSHSLMCISDNTLLIMHINNFYYGERIMVRGLKVFTNELIHNNYNLNSISKYDREFFTNCFAESEKVYIVLNQNCKLSERFKKIQELIIYIFDGMLTKAEQLTKELTNNTFNIKGKKILKGNEVCYLYDLVKYIIRNGV